MVSSLDLCVNVSLENPGTGPALEAYSETAKVFSVSGSPSPTHRATELPGHCCFQHAQDTALSLLHRSVTYSYSYAQFASEEAL